MKSHLQISLYSLLLVLGLLFTTCEVVPEGDRDNIIFTPTDPSNIKRTSLLIEFTGWKCVFCPTAAEEAHRLKEQYGEDLVVVAMHPKSNQFTSYGKSEAVNYTCPEADSIYIKMGGTPTTNFPKGNVNMVKDATNGYFNNYDKWGTLISQAFSSPKPVLLSQNVYSVDTNVIFVAADITNLDTQAIEATLQVWLTEDSVIGRQKKTDGEDKNYVHNHLMRATISPLWGDVLAIEANMTQQVTYDYTLPEKVVAENCNVVAIVSVNGEVVQANEMKIAIQ
jgi:hypothetical protein